MAGGEGRVGWLAISCNKWPFSSHSNKLFYPLGCVLGSPANIPSRILSELTYQPLSGSLSPAITRSL